MNDKKDHIKILSGFYQDEFNKFFSRFFQKLKTGQMRIMTRKE